MNEEASLARYAFYCCNYVSGLVDIEALAERLAVQMVCEKKSLQCNF